MVSMWPWPPLTSTSCSPQNEGPHIQTYGGTEGITDAFVLVSAYGLLDRRTGYLTTSWKKTFSIVFKQ